MADVLPTIRVLPDLLANQIAAGEVVERPVSVVKELVENSLDAGASRIEVRIEEGGRRLIQVSDDGHGMEAAQVPLALLPHATSKIATTDDLFHIRTLGFRGEALPSIASISHFELASRPRHAPEGVVVRSRGGRDQEVEPIAMPVGTRVGVGQLFFNTPVRLKFLRGEQTEVGHVTEFVQRMALCCPEVGFRLLVHGRESLSARPGGGMRERIAVLFGDPFPDNCLEFDARQEGLRLYGWLGLPSLNRVGSAGIHLFVNRRFVRDKVILHMARDVYRELLPADRHPLLALFLEMDPGEVDVNVHPTKQEVRFRHQNFIYAAVRRVFQETLAGLGSRTFQPATLPAPASFSRDDGVMHTLPPSALRPLPSLPSLPDGGYVARPFPGWQRLREEGGSYRSDTPERPAPPGLEEASGGEGEVPPEEEASGTLGRAVAQIHGLYVLAETPDGLVIVDQHAAHERIVLEELKAAFAGRREAGQGLLQPEVVELPPGQAEVLARHLERLRELGLVVEPFGERAFVIRAVPAVLGSVSPRGLLEQLALDLEQFGESSTVEAAREKILATMACHGSVRSGRKLVVEEMNALLRRMETTLFSGHCGHGRPTHVTLTLAQIEKLFGRR